MLGALLLLCLPLEAAWHSDTQPIMGTRVHVEFWLDDADTRGPLILASAMEEMLRIDFAFSPYKEDSELTRMNRDAPNGWVAISPEMKAGFAKFGFDEHEADPEPFGRKPRR